MSRLETLDIFYHGFDNYLLFAYPEDELKPLLCQPLTRDRDNPGHVEVNDVLGNYSLTLVDSLSTLAILASSAGHDMPERSPLRDFQDGIASLVELYGDGSQGVRGQGSRARGFDLDSKVQVFETVIRGVGGLLSAHLFAIGELPIKGYSPQDHHVSSGDELQLEWPNGFIYDGQLLRLARDLATRLLPAFHTVTGLPYPRVNLRHGVPFYTNSPLNWDPEGHCDQDPGSGNEITETCSAGAGSLVLEFTVLSRLTGDATFEFLAKRAFHAVWERRSDIGLIGAGIDAESGDWVAPYAGIGAGIDSFFEYAVKSHILLSGLPDVYATNETLEQPDFLDVWHEAHAGIKRHLYRGSAYQHAHYIQGDVNTGATRAYWMDSLSAYYPGLLTLSGMLDEAIETHMLFAALWNRYSALPERWNAAGGSIDQGLRWWPGRPEFTESTYYIYLATKDPWYLHVGEMIQKDIKLRCKTECGWAGLEDVRTGELKDRMESFFLGETAKYMYLLFDPSHPLNHLDAPFVFTTEGHPLIIPRRGSSPVSALHPPVRRRPRNTQPQQCPQTPPLPILGASAIAARPDFFHAASLARLHQVPFTGDMSNDTIESSMQDPRVRDANRYSPNGFTFYPWTLPQDLVPADGWCSEIESRVTFDLSFPTLPNSVSGPLTLRRVGGAISISSVSGLKLSMIREHFDTTLLEGTHREEVFRIHAISHLSLGRDESVTISPEVVAELNPVDPYFTRHRDVGMLDIVVDAHIPPSVLAKSFQGRAMGPSMLKNVTVGFAEETSFSGWLSHLSSMIESKIPLESVIQSAGALLHRQSHSGEPHHMLEAAIATGPGAAPLPDIPDATLNGSEKLLWHSFYFSDETCGDSLPSKIGKEYQVVVMKRGGCTFSEKLRRIPSFAPSRKGLQLIIFVSAPELDGDAGIPVRPFLDEPQHTPSGVVRPHQIPVVMVEGGDAAYQVLKSAQGIGIRRRYHFSSQGLRISNLYVV